jgi:uncharacterized protein YjgD (DUF1641 family)
MDTKTLEARVDAMDQKLDAIMAVVQQQRQSAVAVEDLVSDLSIIGKDAYDTAVEELDKRKVEIEPAELTELGIAFLKNLHNFNKMMKAMESAMDLMADLSPILNEVIIDVTKKFGEFDEKGYFEFIEESGKIVDNVITGFTKEDVRALADNIVLILSTLKDLTQPKMLKSIDNAVKVFSNIETEDIPEVSVWKLMRTMNKPEIKKGIGFLLTFMQNISKNIED